MKRYSQKVKVLRETKKDILELLKKVMIEKDETEIKINNSTIKLVKPKPRQKKVSREILAETLCKVTSSNSQLNDLLDSIFEDSDSEEIEPKIVIKKN
ncbi:MAG TPA: hypothetical protein V6C58_17505 [Allocoleopsis sp.]